MKVQHPCLQCFLLFAAAALGGVAPGSAQALHSERLANGTVLLVVGEPLSDATTVVWPVAGGAAPAEVTSGDMTLISDLEAALTLFAGEPAPPIVIAAGGAPVVELRGVLERTLAGRPPAPLTPPVSDLVDEARLERRLGAPGSQAEIRLRVNLPPPADPMRTSAEVLWDILPEVLAGDLAGLRSRVDGNVGFLEARVDAERVDLTLRQLRLGLARITEDPRLRDEEVAAAARRLTVQRRAFLEKHPAAALHLLALWSEGGLAAIREYLFAAEGVTLTGVREAARGWLPQHPGSVVVILPPQALNPRFAAPPQVVQLESGLTAAILERPSAPLAVVCLRPVVIPDLDDEMAATILTRIARELRAGPERPGWIEVASTPPRLEMAAPTDSLAELAEALRAATDKVAKDQRSIPYEPGDARRRALRLTAGVLGIAEGSELAPITLLRQDNLALGLVAEDGEAAVEAVNKFWAGGEPAGGASVRQMAPVPRTREAIAGNQSSIVVTLELPLALGVAQPLVLADLLVGRGLSLFPDAAVEVLAPFVPGRTVLLLVVTAVSPLEDLESALEKGWKKLTAPVDEAELARVRRGQAAAAAARWSGATGQARRCAAVAVGEARWQPASELEMNILSVSEETVNLLLSGLRWETLQATAAGVLPIGELERR